MGGAFPGSHEFCHRSCAFRQTRSHPGRTLPQQPRCRRFVHRLIATNLQPPEMAFARMMKLTHCFRMLFSRHFVLLPMFKQLVFSCMLVADSLPMSWAPVIKGPVLSAVCSTQLGGPRPSWCTGWKPATRRVTRFGVVPPLRFPDFLGIQIAWSVAPSELWLRHGDLERHS